MLCYPQQLCFFANTLLQVFSYIFFYWNPWSVVDRHNTYCLMLKVFSYRRMKKCCVCSFAEISMCPQGKANCCFVLVKTLNLKWSAIRLLIIDIKANPGKPNLLGVQHQTVVNMMSGNFIWTSYFSIAIMRQCESLRMLSP